MKGRSFRLIAALGVTAVVAGLVLWRASLPRYSFLSGLEPVYRGDSRAIRIPAVAVQGSGSESFQMEVFSFRGDYEAWARRIETVSATEELTMGRDVLPLLLPTSFPRSTEWVYDYGALSRAEYQPVRGVVLVEGVWASASGAKKTPGWLTIVSYEYDPPTFLAKIAGLVGINVG